MIHEILTLGQLRCNCSIFGDETSREAIVIDPGDSLAEINTVLEKHALKVKAIIITHGHIDHVAGAAKLRAQTGAPVYMNERDGMQLDLLDMQASWLGMETPERPEIDAPAVDGTVVELAGSSFEVRETPGHTQGSICIWIPQQNTLIAGDTLFRDSVGRTDLPGGDGRMILASIKTKLFELPDDALVVPGHGRNTTVGREKQRNPFLQGI